MEIERKGNAKGTQRERKGNGRGIERGMEDSGSLKMTWDIGRCCWYNVSRFPDCVCEWTCVLELELELELEFERGWARA